MIKKAQLIFYIPLLIITAVIGLIISIHAQGNTKNEVDYDKYVKKRIEEIEDFHLSHKWVAELMNGLVWGTLLVAILF